MRILGLDYGHKRIGLAYADELKIALPVKAATQPSQEDRLEYIASIIKERRVQKIVVGYPYNMDGSIGAKAKEVDEFITLIAAKFSLPVDKTDERLSSFQAECNLSMITKKHAKSVAARRKHRQSGQIDSSACALFLQEYIDHA